MQVADKAAFDKWHIYYVDERVVPHTSPDSTHKAVTETLLSKVGRQLGCAHHGHQLRLPTAWATCQQLGTV